MSLHCNLAVCILFSFYLFSFFLEKQMECKLAGETEVLGENLPQRHYCSSQNPTWPDPGLNPGRRGRKPATILFIYLFDLWDYWHCGHSWPIVPASGDSEDNYGEADGMKIGGGNRSSRRKPTQRHFCPSQNPTWPDLVLNPGLRDGKPTTNRLSYGAAFLSFFLCVFRSSTCSPRFFFSFLLYFSLFLSFYFFLTAKSSSN
jgi:hypothetical protein